MRMGQKSKSQGGMMVGKAWDTQGKSDLENTDSLQLPCATGSKKSFSQVSDKTH